MLHELERLLRRSRPFHYLLDYGAKGPSSHGEQEEEGRHDAHSQGNDCREAKSSNRVYRAQAEAIEGLAQGLQPGALSVLDGARDSQVYGRVMAVVGKSGDDNSNNKSNAPQFPGAKGHIPPGSMGKSNVSTLRGRNAA